ncbi:DUF4651 domain-containing protein [Streptococcus iniae]|uniref:DUF4651 domain-containing protein n=1 Tax=Streptococcus iniae TaxID=1346 RepID=UPI0008D9CDEC|nr:DUF4651 domain-containing protein [Streptococcus iniae]OHX26353.1 hypothetical protein BKX95_10765 [Streptococcus iniae]RLV28500.1 DUF4651 domain-containing protein [Streptococcus iniae]
MKTRKRKHLSHLLGASALAVTALLLKEKYDDKKKERCIRDLRHFFSEMGTIDVLYFDHSGAASSHHQGGLVLSDGRCFSFTYDKGEIVYQEDML